MFYITFHIKMWKPCGLNFELLCEVGAQFYFFKYGQSTFQHEGISSSFPTGLQCRHCHEPSFCVDPPLFLNGSYICMMLKPHALITVAL